MSATDPSLTSGRKHTEVPRAIAPGAADPEAAEAAEERRTDRWLLKRIAGFLGDPPVEFVVRGYLTGSLWRDYQKGVHTAYGVPFPTGMKKDQKR